MEVARGRATLRQEERGVLQGSVKGGQRVFVHGVVLSSLMTAQALGPTASPLAPWEPAPQALAWSYDSSRAAKLEASLPQSRGVNGRSCQATAAMTE